MFDDDEEELYSDEGNDDGFDEDMEALTRACTITGTDINDLEDIYDGGANICSPSAEETDRDSSGGLEDDFELFRKVQSRFSKSDDSSEPISLQALRAIHPDSDNEDDDFQTLCAVRRRFSAYDASENARRTIERNPLENPGGVDIENAVSELDNLNGSSPGRKNCKVFPDSEDTLLSDNMDVVPSSTIEQQLDALEKKGFNSFPKSAQLFMNAIKKNRSCQKFLQSKMAQIEARMEENKKLKERVKILKDFEAKCKKSTSRALGLEKHQYVRLISAQKTENCKDMEVNGKKVSAMCYGPVENSHVANYREALRKYPVLFKQKNWTEEERENLKKGIRRQFQEMVLQHSLDEFSGQEGSYGDSSNLDAILTSIRDLEITPERCREFLPKVNWDQLSSLYAVGHSAAECVARWLNIEDPLINHGEWTVEEDKKLLFIVQEKGMTNWFDIAVLHGMNRTPFQCLARFQRSLNARIIKREWTKEEDAQLCIAVETFGDNDWQSVASTLEGRTGSQCSNRWHKSLHPDISRVGRWTPEESIRLKVAVMLFGPKNWRKIAHFVPGRTHVKCRERWFNCEDPSLKRDKWTEGEDLRLKEAIQEHGYCWTKIAKCLAPRTDNQCRRRWMALFPQEVPLLQAVRNTQKAAIISNFVDRESSRPRLGPHDFVSQPLIKSISGSDVVNKSKKRKRIARKGIELGKDKVAPPSNTSKRRRSLRLKERTEISNSPVENDRDESLSNSHLPRLTTSRDSVDARKKKKPPVIRKCNKDNGVGTKRRIKPTSGNQDGPLSIPLRVNGVIVYTRRKKKPPLHSNELSDCRALVPVCTELADNNLHSNYLAGNCSVSQFNSSRKSTKLPVRRKVHTKLADDVKGLTVPIGINKEDCFSSGLSLRKINKAPKYSRKRSSELLEQDRGVVELDEPKKSTSRKSWSKQVLDATEDCDVTLASFLQDRSCPKQVLDSTDDCDVTLASFLRKRRARTKAPGS